jgi:hypothetical protein
MLKLKKHKLIFIGAIFLVLIGYTKYDAIEAYFSRIIIYFYPPADYREATNLLNKKVSSCDDLDFSMNVIHKYEGTYVIDVESNKEDAVFVHPDKRKAAAKNFLQEKFIDKEIKGVLKIKNLNNEIIFKQNNFPQIVWWGGNKKRFSIAQYNVSEDVPAKQNVILEFKMKNCSEEFISSLGEIKIIIRKLGDQ